MPGTDQRHPGVPRGVGDPVAVPANRRACVKKPAPSRFGVCRARRRCAPAPPRPAPGDPDGSRTPPTGTAPSTPRSGADSHPDVQAAGTRCRCPGRPTRPASPQPRRTPDQCHPLVITFLSARRRELPLEAPDAGDSGVAHGPAAIASPAPTASRVDRGGPAPDAGQTVAAGATVAVEGGPPRGLPPPVPPSRVGGCDGRYGGTGG